MVEEVLKTGQRNALSPEYLAKRLNLGTVRALQKQVENESVACKGRNVP